MGGGSYIPLLGSWMWWDGNSWQTQETAITGVQNSDELRLRLCVHETGGKAGSNQDVQLVYSTNSDLSGAVEFGAPSDTDKVFRWRDDTGITEHASIDQARLSCTTENGLSHEQTCTNSEDIGASAHHELEVIFEPYDMAGETTYYIGLVLESTTLDMNSEISAYPNLTSGTIATEHYQTVTDQAGLVDTVAKVQTAHKTVADISGLVDSVEKVWVAHKTVSDIAGLVDSVATVKKQTQTVTDISGLVDSVALKQAFQKTVSDIAGLLDSVGVVHTPGGGTAHYQTITDIAGLLDSVAVTHTPAAPTPPPRRASYTRSRTIFRTTRTPHEFFLDHLDDWPDLLQYLKLKHGFGD